MENPLFDEEKSKITKCGKTEQQKELESCFKITDNQLEGFLTVNFDHIGLKKTDTQDEDVALITWYTKKKFLCALQVFSSLNMLSLDKPSVLPFIKNIINEKSPKINSQPLNFKGKLYPPQASLIKRMMEIESSPILFELSNKTIVKFHCGVVTERLSFGKTFCLPALICEKKIPYESSNEKLINTNLIICGTKVVKEWKNNLKNLTNIEFLVAEQSSQLTILENMVFEKRYPNVLVVKDGDITWKGKKTKAINHVTSLFENKMFARVIYDDYDMLKFNTISIIPETLFTWFISGTDDNWNSDLSFYYFVDNEKKEITINKAGLMLDAVSSLKCNREYSATEFNIPKIDEFYVCYSLPFLIKKIIDNDKIDYIFSEKQLNNSDLITGIKNVPYVYNKQTMKILIAIADKKERKDTVNELNKNGIKSIKLTRANVNKFERENAVVCVSGNLFGVNMGFLTHIVINTGEFDDSSLIQIIGRGQRLSRKQNLQVYFNETSIQIAEEI